ncbi:MAG TPA: glycosyl hydrolase family 8 [Actinomycetota bacterium]|nr:glycosyl hydrolase family 8 [Actinomycetota bacterium]
MGPVPGRTGVFHNDGGRVNYLLIPRHPGEFHATNNEVALQARQHAQLVKSCTSGTDLVHLRHVNRAIGFEQDPQAEAANTLARAFNQGGAFTAADGSVTSEAQAYALLRAVWSNDPEGFDAAWAWSQAHLLRPDGLCSWLWRGGAVADPSSATDADTDMAYALLVAGKRWGRPALESAGNHMAQAIWATEVVTVQGRPCAVAGDWGSKDAVLPINPSYFSPFAYRVFGAVDPGHDWLGLLDAGYELIDSAARAPLGGAASAGLPPDWIGLDRTSGALVALSLPGKNTTQYSFDAARTFWRVALDDRWANDGRGAAFLQRAQFLGEEVGRKGTVSAAYAHDGSVVLAPPSTVSVAGALAALMTIDGTKADALYWGSIVGAATPGPHGSTWGDPADLYAQEWAWFAAAFYNNTLPDLWAAP